MVEPSKICFFAQNESLAFFSQYLICMKGIRKPGSVNRARDRARRGIFMDQLT